MTTMAMALVCLFAGLGMVFSELAPTSGVPDCSSALLNLADCLSFVQEGSKLEKPQGHCCSGLKKVVKEEPTCLCEAFKQSSSFMVKLNMTKAFTLPHACGVSTPSLSNCNIGVAGGPGSAPAPSPGRDVAKVPASAPGTHSMAPLLSPSMPQLTYLAIVVFFSFIV
ncbi:hypothetical protein J5N97_006954 [Dioscorea zingiberensis]|uniref:Bifunctional inhibitor/plant lipid transfer protein/seed storage helical domain-containing protein n=1 Tax=Dioscorea zingiberensis TaxID=325984 RepID=A0A9D5DCM0_9LILI|nr:hypothetical protein J5N97_006954 [Dioscorea zingiberensis]